MHADAAAFHPGADGVGQAPQVGTRQQLVLIGEGEGVAPVRQGEFIDLGGDRPIECIVAVGTGVPLGLLMGWNRKAEALINPVFTLIRPIPPLAWIPLAILWLGLGDAGGVRVGLAPYSNDDDVDRLIAGLRDLTA